MNRIFAPLALFAVLFVVAVMLIGLGLRWGDVRDAADVGAQRMASFHRLTGIAAAITVLLVNSIGVTYFIGTGRWCKEVVEAYRLDAALYERALSLKRRTFPVAIISMLTMVGMVALGGASDPAASMQPPQLGPMLGLEGLTWTQIHLSAALLGICVIAWGFFTQAQQMLENQALINEILAEVKRIRTQRGLD